MSAPDRERAKQALLTVQSLPPEVLDRLVTEEIGDNMLGVLKALAQARDPQAGPDRVAELVHLMVLAYLLRREVEEATA